MFRDLQQTLDDVSSSVSGMTETQLDWRPAGKWSTAQILEHLALAYSGTAAPPRKPGSRSGFPPRFREGRLLAGMTDSRS